MNANGMPVNITGRRPAWMRFGSLLLLGDFIALLAGRFTLDRLNDALPAIDLRLIAVYLLLIMSIVWHLGARPHLHGSPHTRSGAILSAWMIWMALSSTWAPPGSRVIENLIDFAFMGTLLALAATILTWLPSQEKQRLWYWIFIIALVYLVAAMISGPGDQGRYAAFGGGPNVFVRVMVLGAIASVYISTQRKGQLPLLAIPAFALGAALSGSRGGLVSALLLLPLFTVPLVRLLGRKRTATIAIVLGIGALLALSWKDGYALRFVQQRYIQQTLIEGYSSGRSFIAQDALEIWYRHPILGTGLDGYYPLQNRPYHYEYPHNLILASSAEGGLIALLLLLSTIVAFTVAARSRARSAPSVIFALTGGLYLLGTSMFSGNYYDSRLAWFFMIFAIAGSDATPETREYRPVVPLTSERHYAEQAQPLQ